MRWQNLSHAMQHQGIKRWSGLPHLPHLLHHEFKTAEIHAMIGVGALLVVGMLMALIAWRFW